MDDSANNENRARTSSQRVIKADEKVVQCMENLATALLNAPVKVRQKPGPGLELQETKPLTLPSIKDLEAQSSRSLTQEANSLSAFQRDTNLVGKEFNLTDPNGNQYLSIIEQKDRIIEGLKRKIERQEEEHSGPFGVEAQTRRHSVEPTEPELLPRSHKLKVTDSEKHSLGYETMTTTDSDIGSELFVSEQKVTDWFSRQHELESSELVAKVQVTKLLNEWKLDHVEPVAPDKLYASNSFTVSESGAVGISCWEKPSLSIIYPGTDKPPLVLSDDKIYRSATFVKLSSREFLAANCINDGNLYLTDLETTRKVFDLKAHVDKSENAMNIFVIDYKTVGYGEVAASPDGSRRVLILNTDTEEWSLSSTIRVNSTKDISDMSYIKAADGTPCLLLCLPHDHSVQAVEMVGGRVRWNTGKQQMGENFKPWSICADYNTIYVADLWQHKIHLLSPEDGIVIWSTNLRQYGILLPFTVRCYGEYLYVEYCKTGSDKYSICKLAMKPDQ